MDDERRDQLREELRERNRRRASSCDRCGHSIRVVDGASLDPTCHFAGVRYRVCGGCGYERALASKRPKKVRL